MSSSFQTIAALAIVAVAVAWLLWRTLSKRNKPGCGGGCGCPASEIKATLKSKIPDEADVQGTTDKLFADRKELLRKLAQ